MGRRTFTLLLVMLAAIGWRVIGALSNSPLLADEPAATAKPTEDSAASAAGIKLFNDHVHGILVSKCVKCHGGQKTEAGFSLVDREGLLKGGDSGVDVVAGKAAESPLLKLIRHEDEPNMPKDGAKLSDEEITSISDWIDSGAPYSESLAPKGAPKGHPTVTAEDRKFWSFVPLATAQPPSVNDASWCRMPIDQFILAKLEEKGITPNAAADRRILIRRAYFDLIGLPPTPEEIESFVNDPAPDAYPKLIDRLLDNPHFGERWGRHWLDVARFAESHGYEQDYNRPHAFHYRDFVIRAFNSDMPYDQFVRWQIAGDECNPDDPDAWMATGFLAAGTHATQITANQAEKERYDELDDQASTVGTAFLGLTVGCARCHDHKFDPIPTRDYYRMIATFTNTVRSDYSVVTNAAEYHQQMAAFNRDHAPLAAKLANYEESIIEPRSKEWLSKSPVAVLVDSLPLTSAEAAVVAGAGFELAVRASDEHYLQLWRDVIVHDLQMPQPKTVKALICSEGVPAVRLHTQGPDFYDQTFFLQRGDLNQKIEPASAGFLRILMPEGEDGSRWTQTPPADGGTSYHRRSLANWITDANGGAGQLLARVIVNRLWQHHFGRGLVSTPSDFGAQGVRPTHPELLDWLASELIRGGWRLKPLHKLMMTSAAYMETADHDLENAKLDPDNFLCWRHTRQRLEAEIIRDAMLAVSGTLDETMFGPGSLKDDQPRRSIYFTIKRSKMIPVLTLFDAPDSLQGAGQRPITTIAPQALWMMNNPQVQDFSKGFAKRLEPALEKSPEEAVKAGYNIAVGRSPTERELASTAAFLKAQIDSYKADGKSEAEAQSTALANTCQVLFSLNEFIFVE